ncbi:hypothetical protein R84B8_03203 [Treponema sp. R8-4-B8]
MTVRKTTLTTLSVLVLITVFVLISKFYIVILSRIMHTIFHIDKYAPIILGKLFPNNYIGHYYPLLFYICIIAIIAARILDAIIDGETAFKVLSHFISPLIMTGIITIALCINILNMFQLWGIIYLCALICLHLTFKKILVQTESVGINVYMNLIKDFFETIKDTIEKAVSTGIDNFRNPVDEVITLFMSAVVFLLEAMVFVSFIVYMSMHWRVIFLPQI